MTEGSELKRHLKSALHASDTVKYSEILHTVSFPPTQLSNDSGYTGNSHSVLHDLADFRVSETVAMKCLDLVISLFQVSYPATSKSSLQDFTNKQTTEERKSVLYLCTQNHRIVCPTQALALRLLELGADPTIPDHQGNNCLHTAAARNEVRLVYFYLKVCDMDIYTRNNKGRTPLHAAALEGADQVATVIIAWSKDLNCTDDWGMTPLHLAAFSQCYRIVRHLLMSGAKRSIRDQRNATARDLALSRNNLELAGMLKEPSCWAMVNPLKTPLQPSKNTHWAFILYHIVFLVRYAVVSILLLPWIETPFAISVFLCFLVSFLLYEVTSSMDPGYLTKRSDRDFSYLYKKYDPDYVCAYCETKRNKTVRHCQHCNRCVKVPFTQQFDHHCPWLHNCVGKRYSPYSNFKLFFVFLCVNVIDFALQLTIGVMGTD